MTPSEMLTKMLVAVTTLHAGQYDKGGRPLHPLKVMHYLKSDDDELNCIALAHDLVEDTSLTYQDLRDDGFSERVIEGIKALTKVRGESYAEYKAKVMSNRDAMLDLRHNSDIRRLKGVTAKDIARIEKYHAFYMEIKESLVTLSI